MMDDYGQPKPRHSYIHMPQPGRRGLLVHSHQQPNGAAPTGVAPGGYGYGYGAGYGYGVGAVGAYYPGVTPSNSMIYPLYHGPNVSTSTYSDYSNYLSPYSYSNYYSPYYSSYGCGLGLSGGYGVYANYYYPYQRSYYYTSGVAAAPAYSYAYPATTTTTVLQPAATTYTVTNGTVPVTTTASVAAPRVPTRDEIQNENVRIAIQRGATNARRIKPADALPDDPFWCKERNGEWHLRSFYQIENECQPGLWKINAESGMLTFERL
ncbi:hypothetical protein BU26DRAFT_607183 [Trematosphaeria pertusa]|uniref:Uncharacterized protein n=1 Tax=Trematosphaeria pertusa TaxID=390896 RepID=A0A6A6I731_9PLEO|nr:uncharacterized protein BU26DRAFT_607183 [Trematosphaeria pertusa]KAF2245878.1 hypothetical protein BU26DRAFT_607183 [Trematosphaeria pertusa]